MMTDKHRADLQARGLCTNEEWTLPGGGVLAILRVSTPFGDVLYKRHPLWEATEMLREIPVSRIERQP